HWPCRSARLWRSSKEPECESASIPCHPHSACGPRIPKLASAAHMKTLRGQVSARRRLTKKPGETRLFRDAEITSLSLLYWGLFFAGRFRAGVFASAGLRRGGGAVVLRFGLGSRLALF